MPVAGLMTSGARTAIGATATQIDDFISTSAFMISRVSPRREHDAGHRLAETVSATADGSRE
jgi:hypothetical protein